MANWLQTTAPFPMDSVLRWDGLSIVVGPRSTILQLDRPSGRALPPAGRCLRQGRTDVLSIGPDRYLILDPDRPEAGTSIDVSSAWARLVVAGPNAVALLAKGCTLDLHPRVFDTGACVVTGFARMRIVLWRPDAEPRYDMLIGRSYALSLWKWLTDAAAAFGADEDENERAGTE